MITNDRQYKSTRAVAEQIEKSLAAFVQGTASDVNPVFANAQRAALESQLKELRDDLDFYDELRSGSVSVFEADSLRELPNLLIAARIARGMSQKDLASFLGLHEQQIQRYEAEQYRAASLDRLIEISDALDVRIAERAELVSARISTPRDAQSYASFPITEMYKRGYFEDFAGTAVEARRAADELVAGFLRDHDARWACQPLHRRSMRSQGPVLESSLVAWEVRVMTLADRNPPPTTFDARNVTADWLHGLTRLSAEPQLISTVPDYLRAIGISLVVEQHLPGTSLDGAALLTENNVHVVALTLRHDRADNFWFTLLHEIGHLVLHIKPGELLAIFDDNDAEARTLIEGQADEFAGNAAIPPELWDSCVSRFTRTEKAVLQDAARIGISPSIIAGRVRKEANNYTILGRLVGSGEVRKYLSL